MNLATLLRRAAADHGDRVALRIDDGETQRSGARPSTDEVSYTDLADRAARFAGFLRATGVGEGDRVAVFAPNCLEYLIALWGAWQAGAVGVPLNHMFPDAPLRHAMTDCGARLVVLPPTDVERVETLLEGNGPAVLTTGPTCPAGSASSCPIPWVSSPTFRPSSWPPSAPRWRRCWRPT